MSEDIDKRFILIRPDERMPSPNQHFYIMFANSDGGEIFPAILTQYCDSRDFFKNCKVFSKGGEILPTNEYNIQRMVGWSKMYEGTKTFKIDEKNK
tara:strand:+ start:58 stop:345 length:288 start_codon:yes stop_codon:yes gene_type:complete